jgi:hypothetical protein
MGSGRLPGVDAISPVCGKSSAKKPVRKRNCFLAPPFSPGPALFQFPLEDARDKSPSLAALPKQGGGPSPPPAPGFILQPRERAKRLLPQVFFLQALPGYPPFSKLLGDLVFQDFSPPLNDAG